MKRHCTHCLRPMHVHVLATVRLTCPSVHGFGEAMSDEDQEAMNELLAEEQARWDARNAETFDATRRALETERANLNPKDATS